MTRRRLVGWWERGDNTYAPWRTRRYGTSKAAARRSAASGSSMCSVVRNSLRGSSPDPGRGDIRSRVALASYGSEAAALLHPPPPPAPFTTIPFRRPTLTVARPTDDSRGVSPQCVSVPYGAVARALTLRSSTRGAASCQTSRGVSAP